MALREETETTVSGVLADGYLLIGTNRTKHISRLDKEVLEGRAVLVKAVDEWREYKVSADDFDPLTGFKKRVSESTRVAMAKRMSDMHATGAI